MREGEITQQPSERRDEGDNLIQSDTGSRIALTLHKETFGRSGSVICDSCTREDVSGPTQKLSSDNAEAVGLRSITRSPCFGDLPALPRSPSLCDSGCMPSWCHLHPCPRPYPRCDPPPPDVASASSARPALPFSSIMERCHR